MNKTDTKFSVAIHILILISESSQHLNSNQMARSVGTNASYIRKILSLLKNGKIINNHQGIKNYKLITVPERITLLQIYNSVTEKSRIHLLDIHKNSNDHCVVGRYIKPTLSEIFMNVEKSFTDMLASKTLADCINTMRNEISTDTQFYTN